MMIMRLERSPEEETSEEEDQNPPRLMPQCIAFDPQHRNRAYWGTFDNGMLKTDDRGQSWINVGSDVISSPQIMSVAVSSLNGGKARYNKVYAGTEPTALYVSNDGGDTWERIKALNDLPSSKTWSFPPRPWTNHVRWIEPDATNPNYLFVAIEAGALVHSRMEVRLGLTELKMVRTILTLYLLIQKRPSESTLLQATDISKVMIMENRGLDLWKV